MEIKLYKATLDDMSWVNGVYQRISFMPSDFSKEYITIAEIEGRKIGLGRLVQIDDELELGGMYVEEEYRGRGVARDIVEHLLQQAPNGKRIYCIPFVHLETFYKSFGFADAVINDELPQEIKTKMGFCGKTYDTKILLLQLVK